MLQFFCNKFYLWPIYVEFFIHEEQNDVITFEIMLESSIIKDGIKEKTRALCIALLVLDDEEKVAKRKKRKEASGWNRDSKERLY